MFRALELIGPEATVMTAFVGRIAVAARPTDWALGDSTLRYHTHVLTAPSDLAGMKPTLLVRDGENLYRVSEQTAMSADLQGGYRRWNLIEERVNVEPEPLDWTASAETTGTFWTPGVEVEL